MFSSRLEENSIRVNYDSKNLHVENVRIWYSDVKRGFSMENTHFRMQWPRENLYLDCFAHEVMYYRYHWHRSEYELDILLHGKQEFCRGTETHIMEEDDLVLIGPGTGHASFSQKENTTALVMRFSASAFKPFLKRGQGFSFSSCQSSSQTRNNPRYRHVRFYAAQILNACYQGGPYSQLTAKASLEMLLVTLCELFDPQIVKVLPEQDEQHQEIVSRIITYLEQNYASKITLEDLAQFSQYNRTYLSTMFKNSVGINFYEYLTRLRFQHALFDLATSNKNLTEIAIDNGFADLKSFNLRFRETLHYTPSEYRSLVIHTNVAAEFHERRLIHPAEAIVQTKLNEYMRLLD